METTIRFEQLTFRLYDSIVAGALGKVSRQRFAYLVDGIRLQSLEHQAVRSTNIHVGRVWFTLYYHSHVRLSYRGTKLLQWSLFMEKAKTTA